MIKRTVIALALLMLIPAAGIYAESKIAESKLKEIKIQAHGESRDKAGVGPVIFPHETHQKIYECDACHPKIFKPELGANQITMKQNMEKKFCGAPSCHNSPKAFPLFHCNKCHLSVASGNVPH